MYLMTPWPRWPPDPATDSGERVELGPGEVRSVLFALHADLTSYVGREGQRIVDEGDVVLRVGLRARTQGPLWASASRANGATLGSNGLHGPKSLFMQGNIQKAARPRRYQHGLIAGAGGTGVRSHLLTEKPSTDTNARWAAKAVTRRAGRARSHPNCPNRRGGQASSRSCA